MSVTVFDAALNSRMGVTKSAITPFPYGDDTI